jgi:hypothetical protein
MAWNEVMSIKGLKGDPGDPGTPGDKGDSGDPGDPGVRGNTWFSGPGVPTDIPSAIAGDYYLDTDTGDVYKLG